MREPAIEIPGLLTVERTPAGQLILDVKPARLDALLDRLRTAAPVELVGGAKRVLITPADAYAERLSPDGRTHTIEVPPATWSVLQEVPDGPGPLPIGEALASPPLPDNPLQRVRTLAHHVLATFVALPVEVLQRSQSLSQTGTPVLARHEAATRRLAEALEAIQATEHRRTFHAAYGLQGLDAARAAVGAGLPEGLPDDPTHLTALLALLESRWQFDTAVPVRRRLGLPPHPTIAGRRRVRSLAFGALSLALVGGLGWAAVTGGPSLQLWFNGENRAARMAHTVIADVPMREVRLAKASADRFGTPLVVGPTHVCWLARPNGAPDLSRRGPPERMVEGRVRCGDLGQSAPVYTVPGRFVRLLGGAPQPLGATRGGAVARLTPGGEIDDRPDASALVALSNAEVSCRLADEGEIHCTYPQGHTRFGVREDGLLQSAPEGTYADLQWNGVDRLCGLRIDGVPICWGSRTHPVLDPSTLAPVRALALDESRVCGLSMDRLSLRCLDAERGVTDTDLGDLSPIAAIAGRPGGGVFVLGADQALRRVSAEGKLQTPVWPTAEPDPPTDPPTDPQ